MANKATKIGAVLTIGIIRDTSPLRRLFSNIRKEPELITEAPIVISMCFASTVLGKGKMTSSTQAANIWVTPIGIRNDVILGIFFETR